ncbi:MAG: glycosyltransferase [Eubacterium sp.]|nr:glycosyltransferase [Eubacterium sp.]
MSEKKKVLIVCDAIQYGGTDLAAIRLQQNLNQDEFECIYCVRGSRKGPLEPTVEQTGVRIIHQPDDKLNYIKSYKYYSDLFKNEHFDIVHCHLPFYSGIVMAAAWKAKIKKRISHSHFSQPLVFSNSKLNLFFANTYRAIMRKVMACFSTDVIGCSRESGIYLVGKKAFNKKGTVLNNGIDTSVYAYDTAIRNEKRKELGVENKTAIGHVGHMYYVKNHSYLIDVFFEFQKDNPDSVLLLVSDGWDREKLEAKVKKLGIDDKVKFLGFRDDIPELMLAMDCFVFPSIHEGFPLTLIEAQAAKLPCIVSDTVTPDVKLSDALSFLSIKENPALWCDEITKMLSLDRAEINNDKVLEEFSIKNVCKKLEKIYLK